MKHDISFQTIIFDLDGTLVNTVPDVRLALNKMLLLNDANEISITDMYPLIGHGARFMIEQAFAKSGIIIEDQAQLKIVLDEYLDFYKKDPVVETQIYPDVLEVLKELKSKNRQLAICTNKPGVMANMVIEKLNLSHFFDIIVAGDEINTPKPDGGHIHEILNRIKAPISSAILVGDSDVDLATAQNAGIAFIGVSYGYSNGTFTSPILIDRFNQLHSALDQAALMMQRSLS